MDALLAVAGRAELCTVPEGADKQPAIQPKALSSRPLRRPSITSCVSASSLQESGRMAERRATSAPFGARSDLSPRAHGSGLFTRGETQVLSLATLGTLGEAQELDNLGPTDTKRYMHHYNFPPFSTGEVKPLRGQSRREVGHGALAERALEPVIPAEETFPYTIRVVSEVLSSNGSTSMASVCGSTLALMDAGVPIKAPVAGVAMGLISDSGGQVQDPDRHSGHRGSPRRHGLQGRRHRPGHHGPADGHQDLGPQPEDDERSALAGRDAPACRS